MRAEDLLNIIKDQINKIPLPFELGTIDSNYSSGRPSVTFDGEGSVSTKTYPYLESYDPCAGDRVILAKIRSSYIILGKIM